MIVTTCLQNTNYRAFASNDKHCKEVLMFPSLELNEEVVKLPASPGVVLVVSVVGWLLPENGSAQFNLYITLQQKKYVIHTRGTSGITDAGLNCIAIIVYFCRTK